MRFPFKCFGHGHGARASSLRWSAAGLGRFRHARLDVDFALDQRFLGCFGNYLYIGPTAAAQERDGQAQSWILTRRRVVGRSPGCLLAPFITPGSKSRLVTVEGEALIEPRAAVSLAEGAIKGMRTPSASGHATAFWIGPIHGSSTPVPLAGRAGVLATSRRSRLFDARTNECNNTLTALGDWECRQKGIHSGNARPAQGVVRIDAGRSSDFRAGVSSLLIGRTGSRSDQQWHKRGNTR